MPVTFELIGTRVQPEDIPLLHDMIERARGAVPTLSMSTVCRCPTSRSKYLHIVAHGTRDEDGRLDVHRGRSGRNSTAIGREELRRSEADLHEAQHLSHTGSWKLDLSSGKVSVSPEIFRIYAVNPDKEIASSDFWFDRNSSRDMQRVRERFERCVAEGLEYEADYRIVSS